MLNTVVRLSKKFLSRKVRSIKLRLTVSFLAMIVPIIMLGIISFVKSSGIVRERTEASCINTVLLALNRIITFKER